MEPINLPENLLHTVCSNANFWIIVITAAVRLSLFTQMAAHHDLGPARGFEVLVHSGNCCVSVNIIIKFTV